MLRLNIVLVSSLLTLKVFNTTLAYQSTAFINNFEQVFQNITGPSANFFSGFLKDNFMGKNILK